MVRLPLTIGAVTCLVLLVSTAVFGETPEEQFEKDVRPLLIQKCVECHSGMTPDGDLDLSTHEGFLEGGTSGEIIDGKETEFSLLFERIITPDGDTVMPPEERLSEQEVAAVKQWIENGSPWPASSDVAGDDASETLSHWSFQPVERPPVPVIESDSWCFNEIDAFVLQQMRAAKIAPVEDAEPLTWLRRLTLDLTGLPPTVRQIQDMEAAVESGDTRGYELREVHRLLASRSYAERQGRRWMDVARYADTSGDGTDTPIPEARYYRDWVIDAFDQDMPYDRFIIEQIAGDLLAAKHPESPEAFGQIIATGFIALSRRFGNSKFADMHQIIDDTIDTVGKSTMGLTLGCARCHHHKFDPVTTEDYYGLYGYFASTQYPHAGTEHQKDRSDMPAIVVPESKADRFESSVAWAVSDKPNPANVKLHLAGDPHRKGDVVPRGFLGFLSGEPVSIAEGESGRLQLAEKIASADNPLFARVMVNRLWQGHFGTGLVASPSNFGRQTSRPLHHALLDFLACELVDSGWSTKHIHELIVTSRVYRISSQTNSAALAKDEANERWWHFPRVRMDAETLRDSILCASGQLELGDGGRHPFKPTDKLKYSQGRPFSEIFDHSRRSVYLMTPRLNKHPLLAMFDSSDANQSTGKRGESTVPLQSLFLMNGEFVAIQSAALASSVLHSSESEDTRLAELWQRVLGRTPTQTEREVASDYLAKSMADWISLSPDSLPAEQRAWSSLARSLFASNEFIYID